MLCKFMKTNVFLQSPKVLKKTLKYLDLQFKKYSSIKLRDDVDEERTFREHAALKMTQTI